MNTIIIPSEFKNMLLYELGVSVVNNDFMFDKFKIMYENKKTFYIITLLDGLRRFNVNDSNKIFFEVEISEEKSFEIKNIVISPVVLKGRKQSEYVNNINFVKGLEENAEYILFLCFTIKHHIEHRRKQYFPKSHQVIATPHYEIDGYVYNPQKVYLLDELIKQFSCGLPTDTDPHRVIHCDCWGVRGHYRHYANGKVIFVEQYQKGRNRRIKIAKPKYYIEKEK